MSNLTIKLVGKGWTSFTGTMGYVPFVDGVSTRACTQREVDHLAAVTRIETLGGDAVGIATRLIGGATIPAPVKATLPRQSDAEKVDEEKNKPDAAEKAALDALPVYTVDALQKVADDKGLAGLREIATPRKLKGRSITDLIEAILAEQLARLGPPKAAETPAAPDAEPETPVEPEPEAPAPDAEPEADETPAIDGEQDANAEAAAALSAQGEAA